MARFIVTSGSKFEPMTYDELVKPVAQLTEAQNATQDEYDTINTETEALRQYITDNPGDYHAKQMYDNYVNKLTALQNNLWDNGYTAQSRRDLAAARAGFASDITRLATAVKSRQERSQEYWKARHDHPDLITGEDPGLSGLDNYLANDLYGRDYYSYSGDTFMSEVGTSAKAAADEMMNDPRYKNNPDAIGYLMRLEKEGYSSSEVQRAGNAVYDAVFNNSKDGLMSRLSEPEKILANVLMTHLDSTGAQGKVSRDEFKRLFDYGVEGLRQAIGTRKVTDLYDRSFVPPKAGNGGGQNNDLSIQGYSINKVVSEYQDPKYKELVKDYGDYYKPYYNEETGENTPVMVHTSDGEPDAPVYSPLQMSAAIYDSPARQLTRKEWGGVDLTIRPDSKDKNTHQKFTHTGINPDTKARFSVDYTTYPLTEEGLKRLQGNKDGAELVRRYNLKVGDPAIYFVNEKTPTVSIAGTSSYLKRLAEHNAYVRGMKDNNVGIDLDKMALSPEKEREFRKKYGIENDIQTADLDAYVSTKYDRFIGSNPVLFNGDDNVSNLRNNLANAIINTYQMEQANGNVGKGTKAAFYKVSDGKTSSEGTTDITQVFPSSDSKGLTYVELNPEDIDYKTGRVQFTLTTPTGVWKVDSDMLGSFISNAFNSPSASGYNLKQKLADMVMPLKNPHKALTMSDKEAENWANKVFDFFNPVNPQTGNYYQKPYGNLAFMNGQPSIATPADIVRNKALRDAYRTSVTRFLNYTLQAIANEMGQHHMRTVGNSSDKARPYMNWDNSSAVDYYDYTDDIDFGE